MAFKTTRESDGDKKIETDLVGRVMLLEQKFRGIRGERSKEKGLTRVNIKRRNGFSSDCAIDKGA